MNAPATDGGGRADDGAPMPVPHASPRVRLEAALLDVERAAPAPIAAPAERACTTVLVVAADADRRRYVRECLRERLALHLVEAATVADAVALAARHPQACLVVDESARELLGTLPSLRAVVLLGDVPHDAPAAPRLRLLAQPFSARELVTEIDGMIG